MPTFTLHDLERRVNDRARESADVSYTRKLLDRGVSHCAKKLGEEAVEAVIAAVNEDKDRMIAEAADVLYHLLGRAPCPRHYARRGRGRARRAHAPIGPRREGFAQERLRSDRMEQRTEADVSPYRVFSRSRLGDAPRRHADDIGAGRSHPAALDARPARMSEVEDIYLPLSRLLLALRGGDAKSVSRAAGLSRHRRRQGSLHHRRRRFGRGRQIDHRARAAGAAGALAERSQGRSDHDRRLSLSQRGSRPRRPDGEEGVSGKLRPAGFVALSLRHQSRPASGARAGLFASDLRRHSQSMGRDRPAGYSDRRRPQCAADRALAERMARPSPSSRTFSISRSISMPRRTCCCPGMSAVS